MQELTIGNCYINTTQLREANAESMRLGFSHNLNLPADLPQLKFPIMKAFRHTSADGELKNIRLMIFFALDTETASDGRPLTLDVTPDWLAVIKNQRCDMTHV